MSLADFDRVISKFVRGIEALAKEAAARAVREALAKQKKNGKPGTPSGSRAGSRRGTTAEKASRSAKRSAKASPKKSAKRAGRSKTSGAATLRPVRSPKSTSAPKKIAKLSEADIDLAAGRIVAYLTTHPRVSSARLRLTLKLSREEWSRASEKLIGSGRIAALGEGAATTYHLPGAAPKRAASDGQATSPSHAAPKSGRTPVVVAPSAVPPIKRVRPQG